MTINLIDHIHELYIIYVYIIYIKAHIYTQTHTRTNIYTHTNTNTHRYKHTHIYFCIFGPWTVRQDLKWVRNIDIRYIIDNECV